MLEVGQLIESKYRIVRLIGEGGMGAVYEGENVRISRRVAIKVLHGGLTANAEVVQRFEREAQAAGRIGNDHILEVLDLGTLPNGEHYPRDAAHARYLEHHNTRIVPRSVPSIDAAALRRQP